MAKHPADLSNHPVTPLDIGQIIDDEGLCSYYPLQLYRFPQLSEIGSQKLPV